MNFILLSSAFLISFFLPVYAGWYDSGELTLAAFTLGVAHPPGEPFYLLVGNIFSLLPIGTPAFRLSLLSMFSTLGSAWLMTRLIIDRLQTHGFSKKFYRVVNGMVFVSLLCIPSLALQTTRVELYTLYLFLFMGSIFLLHRGIQTRDIRYFFLMALVTGPMFLIHSFLAFIYIFFTAIFLLIIFKKLQFQWIRYIQLGFLSLISLAPLVYIPIRAAAQPVLNWGAPNELHRFIHYFMARDYQASFVWPNTFASLSLFFKVLGVIAPFVALLFFSLFLRPKRRMSYLEAYLGGLVAVFALAWVFVKGSLANPDIHGYLLPLIFSSFALGVLSLSESLHEAFQKSPILKTALVSVLAFFIIYYFPLVPRSFSSHGAQAGNTLEGF